MRLNGIWPEVGTIVGIHAGSQRLLTAVGHDDGGTLVRYSTAEEVTPEQFMREPQSVVEHRAIRRRMSPYGLVRQFKPTPRTRVEIELPVPQIGNRKMRRMIEKNRNNLKWLS